MKLRLQSRGLPTSENILLIATFLFIYFYYYYYFNFYIKKRNHWTTTYTTFSYLIQKELIVCINQPKPTNLTIPVENFCVAASFPIIPFTYNFIKIKSIKSNAGHNRLGQEVCISTYFTSHQFLE